MTPDHATVPAGRKTARRRGWRVEILRRLSWTRKHFTARQLAALCPGMTIQQAQALCAGYVRKGELRCCRRGIGGNDPVEALYQRA